MIRFHSDLHLAGVLPTSTLYPQGGEVEITLEDDCICIRMAADLLWNFTEIRIMPLPAFRPFVMSKKLSSNRSENHKF